jgi:hypothetical protein
MSNFRSNTVYICNIEDDAQRFNTQFQYNVVPSNNDMSISYHSSPVKYDDHVYKRGQGYKEFKNEGNVNANTKADIYNRAINYETELRNVNITNNDTNLNKYIAKESSDMYKLNVSYTPQKGNHDLLFEIPSFSSSSCAPNKDRFAFRNSTREQRN